MLRMKLSLGRDEICLLAGHGRNKARQEKKEGASEVISSCLSQAFYHKWMVLLHLCLLIHLYQACK